MSLSFNRKENFMEKNMTALFLMQMPIISGIVKCMGRVGTQLAKINHG